MGRLSHLGFLIPIFCPDRCLSLKEIDDVILRKHKAHAELNILFNIMTEITIYSEIRKPISLFEVQ